jgi:hypothetical protein
MRISLSKKRSWSAVPDDILCNSQLSFSARVVLGYCLGRPDGWTFHVSHPQSVLGLGVAQWRAARRQLIDAGFLVHSRRKGHDGRWVWDMILFDEPTIVHFSADGAPADGQPNHIADDFKHLDLSKGKNAAKNISASNLECNTCQDAASSSKKKKRRQRPSGVVCWDDEDEKAAAALEADLSGEDLREAVGKLLAQKKEPLPGRVARAAQDIGIARAARAAAEERRRARQEAESKLLSESASVMLPPANTKTGRFLARNAPPSISKRVARA